MQRHNFATYDLDGVSSIDRDAASSSVAFPQIPSSMSALCRIGLKRPRRRERQFRHQQQFDCELVAPSDGNGKLGDGHDHVPTHQLLLCPNSRQWHQPKGYNLATNLEAQLYFAILLCFPIL